MVVVCSPRVPVGLLTWPAWQALQTGPVLTDSPDHPQLPALQQAGVPVTTVTEGLIRERVAAGQDVVWLAIDRPAAAEVIEVDDPPGSRLAEAVAVMDRLRSPGGCPWDAQQTHTSLMPYLLEEAYEAYQALEDGDLVDLREELGDVLLQVLFHSRLAQEQVEPWSVDDVAGDLVDKLVRRHPHVFAGASADDLEGSWEALKQAEKGRASVTDGVPLSQPALSLAAKLQKRAARLGAPAGSYGGLGGELWALVARCRKQGVDPEVALRTTARGFRDRLAAAEAQQELPATSQEWSEALRGPA